MAYNGVDCVDIVVLQWDNMGHDGTGMDRVKGIEKLGMAVAGLCVRLCE